MSIVQTRPLTRPLIINTMINHITAHQTENKMQNLLMSLERQEFDLVAVGRALLADPNWLQKMIEGRFNDIISFSPDLLKKLY